MQRNGGYRHYRASRADQAARDRAKRPKPCKLAINRALARLVAKKLQLLWSPEQIAGWLQCTYPEDGSYQVSRETIYRSLFIQSRGALKKELLQHLGSKRGMRRSRHKSLKGAGWARSPIPSRFVSVRLLWKIAPCRAIGKAT
jgi:IS30 family transposase